MNISVQAIIFVIFILVIEVSLFVAFILWIDRKTEPEPKSDLRNDLREHCKLESPLWYPGVREIDVETATIEDIKYALDNCYVIQMQYPEIDYDKAVDLELKIKEAMNRRFHMAEFWATTG